MGQPYRPDRGDGDGYDYIYSDLEWAIWWAIFMLTEEFK